METPCFRLITNITLLHISQTGAGAALILFTEGRKDQNIWDIFLYHLFYSKMEKKNLSDFQETLCLPTDMEGRDRKGRQKKISPP